MVEKNVYDDSYRYHRRSWNYVEQLHGEFSRCRFWKDL